MTPVAVPVLRVARPTDDIARCLPFYVDGLGLEVLARFEDHAGFDGVVLGHPNAPWHLELTTHPDHPAPVAWSADDLLVLYLPDGGAWRAACARLQAAGHGPVAPLNPYWAARGRTYADPDGRRVVLQNADWTA
ncbi:VOC family protein [Jannaschia sp. Os4]|uniref:VOC family protein n=1 Tax=Jannaschia sp. Os4 TaxID=2807617 RepID=UPI001939B52B|nr:VOC family protein [Jannaschia sp. Os4]MBM2577253.1 VOC family protein [Jannaschia sp. Os4]